MGVTINELEKKDVLTGDEQIEIDTNGYSQKISLNDIAEFIGENISSTDNNYTDADKALVQSIPSKVDKVEGKGLSSNDYTDKDKEVVDRLAEFNPEEISTTSMYLTTYSDLRTLKKEGKLIPGAFYRITDFVTATATTDTRSAGHPFDIIVQALDEHTLSEKAQAIQHEGDTYFANSNLDAWQVWYDFDNNTSRFAWAKQWVEESPASWKCGLGLIEERYDTGASTAYTIAVVDGETKYLYRPAEPTNYLEGKEFYEKVLTGSITSPEGFIYEADSAPYNEGDEEEENWYWEDVSEIRVKTADGTLVATLSNYGDGDFIDYERDEMGDYYINMSPNAVWNEEKGVYLYTPNYGVEDWWENCVGGSIDTYDKVPYTGSIDSLYYAFDSILPKSIKVVEQVYSSDTGKIYYSDNHIDTITYTSYIAFSEGHKGVIYRLIDEFNNDVPYDFKNIQFKYEEEWFYTFGVEDNSISGASFDNNINFTNEKSIVPTIFKNVAKWNRFHAVVKTSAIFEGKVHAVSINTTSGGFTTILAKGDLYGGVIDGNATGSLTTNKMTGFHIQSSNNSTFTGTFLTCSFFGRGSVSIVDANGNQKSLRGLRAYFGTQESKVKMVYNGTMSSTAGIKNIELVAPDWGDSEVTVNLDNYKEGVKIAKNSSGVVKVWYDADLVQ